MNHVIVSENGRYHGHAGTEKAAKESKTVTGNPDMKFKFLTDEEWAKTIAAGDSFELRAAVIEKAGKTVDQLSV